jgi:RimJ/RimL family protein N-acetyltransferase
VSPPAYRIHTRRLVLRCWEPTDAPLLQEALLASLEHLRPWMPWAQDEPRDLEGRIAWLRECRGRFDSDRDYVYGIWNRDETQVLGSSGLHTRPRDDALEIGYWVHVAHINQGVATETAAALTKVAFEVNRVPRVEIHCAPDNVRSAAVPRKLGFVHEATLRQRDWTPSGELRDLMIWTLLAAEYPQSPAAAAEVEAFDAIRRRIL